MKTAVHYLVTLLVFANIFLSCKKENKTFPAPKVVFQFSDDFDFSQVIASHVMELEQPFQFSSREDWRVEVSSSTENNSWFTVQPMGGEASSDTISLNIFFEKNEIEEDRVATVVLKSISDSVISINITQEATVFSSEIDFNLSPTISSSATGLDKPFTFTSSADWTIEKSPADAQWFSVDPMSGQGSDDLMTLNIIFKGNEIEVARIATVHVKNNFGKIITLIITQEAYVVAVPANTVILEQSGGFEEAFKQSALSEELESLTIIGEALIDTDFKYIKKLKKLKTLNIKETATTIIPEYAFSRSDNLIEFSLPDDIIEIGKFAFWKCTALATITIPNQVTSIETSVFEDCVELTNVVVSEEVQTIGSFSFSGCAKLNEIRLSNLISIGEGAFKNCTGLTEMEIIGGLTSLPKDVFNNCTALVKIITPHSITSIGESAFENCENIVNFAFASEITNIGASAFKDCEGLTAIDIPNTIKDIGDNAFISCTSLEEIYCRATIPPTLGKGTFDNTSDSKIRVPDEDVYKAEVGNWSKYSSRIKNIDTPVIKI